ncbi:MAG TPA: hypothetical protein VG206_09065 [Terriglobia bacterium]|nr:hypothetical protein [Terriglobia bacterium]
MAILKFRPESNGVHNGMETHHRHFLIQNLMRSIISALRHHEIGQLQRHPYAQPARGLDVHRMGRGDGVGHTVETKGVSDGNAVQN